MFCGGRNFYLKEEKFKTESGEVRLLSVKNPTEGVEFKTDYLDVVL